MDKIEMQQGDLILVFSAEVPETAKKVEVIGNSFIVLRGEGANTHELWSDTLTDDIEVYMDGEVMYLHIKTDVDLVHQEHGKNKVKKGIVRRVIEREWDYEDMEARQTRD